MTTALSLSFAASHGAPVLSGRRTVRSRAPSRVVRASVEIEPGSEPPAPIVVFGAGGKTGKRCVQVAAASGIPVVACTRSGAWNPTDIALTADEKSLVTSKPGDVSKANAS